MIIMMLCIICIIFITMITFIVISRLYRNNKKAKDKDYSQEIMDEVIDVGFGGNSRIDLEK